MLFEKQLVRLLRKKPILFNRLLLKNRGQGLCYHIMGTKETLLYIQKNNASFVRYGDGEFRFVLGHLNNIGFQTNSDSLQTKLRNLLKNPPSNLLVCLPYILGKGHHNNFTDSMNKFWLPTLYEMLPELCHYLSPTYTYGDACISRFYYESKDKSQSAELFALWKTLWEGQDILLIEGEQTRFGIGNDLLDSAKSVSRILVPAKEAFLKYDAILKTALTQNPDALYLLAIGPTAKILASDLVQHKRRVFDVGHLDIEYEWFLRKATDRISIPNKYVNEAPIHFFEEELFDQARYHAEIIETI